MARRHKWQRIPCAACRSARTRLRARVRIKDARITFAALRARPRSTRILRSTRPSNDASPRTDESHPHFGSRSFVTSAFGGSAGRRRRPESVGERKEGDDGRAQRCSVRHAGAARAGSHGRPRERASTCVPNTADRDSCRIRTRISRRRRGYGQRRRGTRGAAHTSRWRSSSTRRFLRMPADWVCWLATPAQRLILQHAPEGATVCDERVSRLSEACAPFHPAAAAGRPQLRLCLQRPVRAAQHVRRRAVPGRGDEA